MTRTHWYAIAFAAFALLGGFAVFQACMGPAGGDGAELGAVDDVDPGSIDTPPTMPLDAGTPTTPPDDPSTPTDVAQQQPQLPTTPTPCAGVTCGAGETCCPSNGACVPSTCLDCCPVSEAEQPAPTIPVPETGGGLGSPVPPAPGPFDPAGPGPRPGTGGPGTGPTPPPPSPE